MAASCGQRSGGEEANATRRPGKLAQMEWLNGRWQQRSSDGGLQTEVWSRENDSVFTGQGSFVQGGDTLFSESLRLLQRGEDLFYVPTVAGQNNGQPVEFRLTFSDGKTWVFENPQHDFPQKITYTRVAPDSLLAEVSGTSQGQEKKESFPMKKLP